MPMPEIKPEKGILLLAGMLAAMVGILRFGIAHVSDMPAVEAFRDPFVAEFSAIQEDIASGTLVPERVEDAEVPGSVHVPILVYHSVREPVIGLSVAERQYEVTPAQFERQMAYISENGFETISFDQLEDALREGTELPEKPVIITLDDGRETQFVNAVPILERHGLTATFFVFTNAIDREGYLTWDQLHVLHARGMEIGSHTVFHPFLTRLPSDDAKREELRKSKHTLEEGLGVPTTTIAHPFGLYDETTIRLSEEEGYTTGRSLVHDANHSPEDLMALGAYIVTGNYAEFQRILDAQ